MTIEQRIAALAAQVRRDTDRLVAEIEAGCPNGSRPSGDVGYLTLAADLLADAARYVARDGLYVEIHPPGAIDDLIDRLAAQPVPA